MFRFLIIDDEKDLAESVRIYLEEKGHFVEVCHDGESAKRLLSRQTFDLVITDIYMPGRNGLELLDHLENHHPNQKVLVMSGGGHEGKEDIKDVFDLTKTFGATRNIEKPFTLTTLYYMIEEILQK